MNKNQDKIVNIYGSIWIVLLVLLSWQILQMLFVVYRINPDFSHGFIVPLLVAYMVRQKWDELRSSQGSLSYLGLPMIFLGGSLVVLALWYDIAVSVGQLMPAFIGALGIITILYGGSLMLGGVRLLEKMALPISFLLFAVPLPNILAGKIIIPLKKIVTLLSATFLRLIQIPIIQEGNILRLPNATLGVADACSGIRSLWVLLTVAAFLGYIMKCKKEKFLLLCVLSIPAAIFGNFLRISVTAMLVAWIDPSYAHGGVHEFVGLAAFIISIGLLFITSHVIQFDEDELSGDEQKNDDKLADDSVRDKQISASNNPLFAGVISLACILLLKLFVLNHYHLEQTVAPDRLALKQISSEICGYRKMSATKMSEGERAQLKPSDDVACEYVAAGRSPMSLSLIYWEPARTRLSRGVAHPHTPDVCMPSQGWSAVEDYNEELRVPSIPNEVVSMRVFQKNGCLRYIAFWRKIGNIPLEDPGGNFLTSRIKALLKSWNSPVVDMGHQYYISISIDVKNRDFIVAKKTLLAFAKSLSPSLSKFNMIRELDSKLPKTDKKYDTSKEQL